MLSSGLDASTESTTAAPVSSSSLDSGSEVVEQKAKRQKIEDSSLPDVSLRETNGKHVDGNIAASKVSVPSSTSSDVAPSKPPSRSCTPSPGPFPHHVVPQSPPLLSAESRPPQSKLSQRKDSTKDADKRALREKRQKLKHQLLIADELLSKFDQKSGSSPIPFSAPSKQLQPLSHSQSSTPAATPLVKEDRRPPSAHSPHAPLRPISSSSHFTPVGDLSPQSSISPPVSFVTPEDARIKRSKSSRTNQQSLPPIDLDAPAAGMQQDSKPRRTPKMPVILNGFESNIPKLSEPLPMKRPRRSSPPDFSSPPEAAPQPPPTAISLPVDSKKANAEPWRFIRGVLQKNLKKHPCSFIFSEPVDPVKLNIPDYFQVIKNPMDLGTVQKKLDRNEYASVDAIVADIRLTFQNAMKYNPVGHEVHSIATELLQVFEERWAQRPNPAPYGEPYTKYDAHSSKPTDPYKIDILSKQITSLQNQLQEIVKQPKTSGPVPGKTLPGEFMSARPMSQNEKRALSENINKLSQDMLCEVVNIIRTSNPATLGEKEDEEIEIDIDALDAVTLRRLEKYVRQCLSKKKPHKKKTLSVQSSFEVGRSLSQSSIPRSTPEKTLPKKSKDKKIKTEGGKASSSSSGSESSDDSDSSSGSGSDSSSDSNSDSEGDKPKSAAAQSASAPDTKVY